MKIFEYASPRQFVKDWLENQPKAGRGLLRQWAARFRVHPSLLSQVITGRRHLTLELTEHFADAMGLSDLETDFFFLLAQQEAANSPALRRRWSRKIQEARTRARALSSRMAPENSWTDTAKGTFYSSWVFSAIRNLTAIPRLQTIDSLAKHLGLPRDLVQSAATFLVDHKLCVAANGKLRVGPQLTYVSADSPFVLSHHQNWRSQASGKIPLRKEADFFLTFPMSLSEHDAEKVRNRLLECFEDIKKIVGPSPSETGRCLNIDYFEI